MKKRWRVAILVAVALGLAMFAAAGWLGFLPFGRPDNEHDFMAEQLNRVRYAGPFRSDDEKAIAELLPDSPTIDDIYIAYGEYWNKLDAERNRVFMEARPEFARVSIPPRDDVARRAVDELTTVCTELETRYPMLDWLQEGGEGWAPDICTAYVGDTDGIVVRLAAATPRPGKILNSFSSADVLHDFPVRMSSIVRVCVARVRCLYVVGRTGDGWIELQKLADYCRDARAVPSLFGQAYYDMQNAVLLDDAVLPLARQRLLSLEQLEDLVARCQLPRPDVAQIARIEFALSPTSPQVIERDFQKVVGQELAKEGFQRYGATSLCRWFEQDHSNRQQRLDQWHERLRELTATGLSIRDEQGAQTLFSTGTEGRGDWVNDQNKLLALAATSMSDCEGLLLALNLHLLQLREPQNWQSRADEVAQKFPFARIERSGDALLVRRNDSHAALHYLRKVIEDRIMATVR